MNKRLKAGDWVEVKSPQEIARTLDENGTLDGLPFMPEMMMYCGRRSQIQRMAEKTCVEFRDRYRIRQFRRNDVLILGSLRCSGQNHDGCGRACVLFWKADWLRKVDGGPPESEDSVSYTGEPLVKIRTMKSPGLYFCQSTELANATEPISRVGIIKKCISEIRSGSRGVVEMAGLMLAPLWRKATQWFPRRRLAGNLKRTPVGDLCLQPGEWVQISSADEIARTLNPQGRNRGLLCDYGMCQYSGGKYQVRNRLERMISEPTGEMRVVENTVILDGLNCLCWNVFGGCPRNDFMYWREIWLSRVETRSPNPDYNPPTDVPDPAVFSE